MSAPEFARAGLRRAGRRAILVGGRLNLSGNPRLLARVLAGDWDAIDLEARAQRDEGADALDVCAAVPGGDPSEEPARLAEMARRARRAADLPLFVDARGADALLAGLEAAGPGAVANSVTAAESDLRDLLPLLARHAAAVVGLAMDERGVLPSAEGRVACAERFLDAGRALGLAEERLIVDCVALPGGADPEGANAAALGAMRALRSRRDVPLLLGISNVTWRPPGAPRGTPPRDAGVKLLRLALGAGLDFAIANPSDRSVRGAIAADSGNFPGSAA